MTTFSSAVALGDGPESVSGVRSVGILHAPGYPSYVLLARLWATVLPFGGWAQRVNLFSVVCAAGAVALVFVLARLFGAARVPAVIGAFSVATSVSFWFNAGFAKHYALSALLVVLLAVLVVSWERSGSRARLLWAGVALGLGLGASWELTVIMAVGLGVLVLFGPRRIVWRDLGSAIGIAAGLFALELVFILLRARQSPSVNWGEATTAGRLVDLLRQKDFLTGAAAPNGVRALPEAPHRFLSYGIISAHELGVAALVVALLGAVVVVRRRQWGESLFFAVVLVGNVVATVFVAGLTNANGITAGVVVGGFLIDLVVVVGVLVAIGTTTLSEGIGAWLTRRRSGEADAPASPAVRGIVCVLVAIGLLVPSVLVHEPYATHRGPALADLYAERVFSELPHNAVLVVWGAEFAEPLRYLQIVRGQRRDVSIFSGAESPLPWYRDELTHDYPLLAPPTNLSSGDYVLQLINNALARGPVYVDMSAISQFGQTTSGFSFLGLVAQFNGQQALVPGASLGLLAKSLNTAQQQDGWDGGAGARFPNRSISLFEVRADLFLASFYAATRDFGAATTEIQQAMRIRPDIAQLRGLLRLAQTQDSRTEASILQIAGTR